MNLIYCWVKDTFSLAISRGGSVTAATSKIERFVIIVDSFQPLTIITKRSLLDVAAALDPPLIKPVLTASGSVWRRLVIQQKASTNTALKIFYMMCQGVFATRKRLKKLKTLQFVKKSHAFYKLLGESIFFISVDIQTYLVARQHISFHCISQGTIL